MHRFNQTCGVHMVTELLFWLFFSLKDHAFKVVLTSKTWKGERNCNKGQSLSSPLSKDTFEVKSAFFYTSICWPPDVNTYNQSVHKCVWIACKGFHESEVKKLIILD